MQWFALYVLSGISLIATIAHSRKDPSKLNINVKIVGGEPAWIEDIPYQLAILNFGKFHCGGSIIAAKWALSAGHCFYDYDYDMPTPIFNMTIVTGTSFWQKGGQKHKLTNVTFHPKFYHYDYEKYDEYDITVLKVSKPFQLGTPGINCIPLATRPTSPERKCLVSGWGYLREGGNEIQEQLRKLMVPVINRRICKKWYAEHDVHIIHSMICAGYLKGEKDSCQGDSGGPLARKNKLVGVVSFGIGCARPRRPGVYTDVYKVRKWIVSVTGRLQCKTKNGKILRYPMKTSVATG